MSTSQAVESYMKFLKHRIEVKTSWGKNDLAREMELAYIEWLKSRKDE